MYIKFIGAAFLIVAGCMSGKEISSNYKCLPLEF